MMIASPYRRKILKTPISVRLDSNLLRDLRACSVKNGMTVTDIIERAAAEWMVPTLADIERERKARINFKADPA